MNRGQPADVGGAGSPPPTARPSTGAGGHQSLSHSPSVSLRARDLVAAAVNEIRGKRTVPGATYRLQLHAGFTFREATGIVPYLAELGITDCYASPYLKAVPGSNHGYDITDPTQLNTEIGTELDHEAWLDTIKRHGLGLLLDVVPNHMGIMGNQNRWWNDVLENGQASPYARFFDIDWSAPTRVENQGRVLLPMLGDLYGVVLENGELRIAQEGGKFHVQYHEHRFPLDPKSYRRILEPALHSLGRTLGAEHQAVRGLQGILPAIEDLPDNTETAPDRIALRQREKQVLQRGLSELFRDHPEAEASVSTALTELNGTAGDPRSFDALDRLLSAQAYRLAYWKVAPDEINYRRFFDVNSLAALRADRDEVFWATHGRILDLLARRGALGLRIDHPDGLLDPKAYLERLQEAFVLAVAQRRHEESSDARSIPWPAIEPEIRHQVYAHLSDPASPPLLYVAVEKILGFDESIPGDWRTAGTSGYDALNRINGLFVDQANEAEFSTGYHRWIRNRTPYPEIARRSKLLILDRSLASELHVLAYQLDRIAMRGRRTRDFTQGGLRQALREVIAAFPVYRSYITRAQVGKQDRDLINRSIRLAMRRDPATSPSVFRFLRDVLINKATIPPGQPDDAPSVSDLACKFQQVTAPVTAKGLEDTAFYVYNRLVSLNEVGGEPDRFGVSPQLLHEWNQRRAERFPHALTALSTHDTKRSEDVRARINVLSEMPEAWFQAVKRWSALNAGFRGRVDKRSAPDRNDEYLFYQTLLGAWPLEPMSDEAFATFRDRICAYMSKAAHEAKSHTSWLTPNPGYDQALDTFFSGVLDRAGNREFFDDFLTFQPLVSHHGQINSLAQTLLRIASPGSPDTYQGTEIWDFSLVDPDNRRPVDYKRRWALLNELKSRHQDPATPIEELLNDLIAHSDDGRIKLYATWRALACRRPHADLFGNGRYEPLPSHGPHAESLFAFQRRLGSRIAVIAVPLLSTRLVSIGQFPVGPAVWGETTLELPGVPPGTRLENWFTAKTVETGAREQKTILLAGEVFADFPIALLLLP